MFKSDRIKLGKGCTLCSGSLTHYGVTMGDHVVLDVNAYLMKGEIMDPYTTWRGNPARAVGDRLLSGAEQEKPAENSCRPRWHKARTKRMSRKSGGRFSDKGHAQNKDANDGE